MDGHTQSKYTWLIGILLLSFFVQEKLLAQPVFNLYTEDYAPFNYQEGGELKGINTEIVRELCRMSQIDCQLQLLPWARALKLTETQKNSGIFSTIKTQPREPNFLWVGPLVSTEVGFYKLKSRKDIQGTSLEEISQFSVGILKGGASDDVLLENGWAEPRNIIKFASVDEVYQLLIDGKLDMVPGSTLSLPYHMAKLGFDVSKVELVYRLEFSNNLHHIAFNLDSDPKIIDRLRRNLDKLHQSGWINELLRNYQQQFLQ